MATQYKIRAKDSVTGDTYFVTLIGTFNPETDLNNPSTNNPPDPDSITIVSTEKIAEEFTFKDDYGIQAVAVLPSALTAFDALSSDFCDITTWYYNSVEVSSETPTTSDHLTYTLTNHPIVNAHKVVDTARVSTNKHFRIFINSVEINHHDISIISNVDYINGTFTFVSDQTANAVTVSYAYVDTTAVNQGSWRITPDSGTTLAITGAKIKMSKNMTFPTPITMTVGINPAIIPGGVAASKTYYTLRDFIGFSGRWEVLPAIGDFTEDVIHLIYEYQGSIVLNADYGMYLELSIQGNTPRVGEIGIASFQCVKLKG